jgi:hypothetical protein
LIDFTTCPCIRFPLPAQQANRWSPTCSWHHWCAHSGSPNGHSSIRQLVVSRFHRSCDELLLTDDGGVGSDGDLWKYFSPAVRAAGAGAAGEADIVSSKL